MRRKSKLPEISDRLESVKVADIDARAAALSVLRDMAEHDVEYLLRHISRLEDALREAMGELLEIGYGEAMYGVFHGGDPRDFTPDPDCSTEQERENHRLACVAAEQDEDACRIGSDCHWTNQAKRAQLPGTTFGLGTNQVRADAERYDRWRMALQDFTPTEPTTQQQEAAK